jgi:hypothetical protein
LTKGPIPKFLSKEEPRKDSAQQKNTPKKKTQEKDPRKAPKKTPKEMSK